MVGLGLWGLGSRKLCSTGRCVRGRKRQLMMDWRDSPVVIQRQCSQASSSFPYTLTQSSKSSQTTVLRTPLSDKETDSRYWKLISFFAPLLGATLVAGYLVKDHHHSSYDVVGGGIIGASIGYAHFRTSYFGVWDYRVNHIPLPREGFPLLGEELA